MLWYDYVPSTEGFLPVVADILMIKINFDVKL